MGSGAHVSMASSAGGSVEIGTFARGRMSKRGGQAARRKAAPLGANSWLRESMCQIAWVSRRAMSTWATFAPRCLPSRVLVALVALRVGGVLQRVCDAVLPATLERA